jgi:hypothetical protein
MSYEIELPCATYWRIIRLAHAAGTTPARWIEAAAACADRAAPEPVSETIAPQEGENGGIPTRTIELSDKVYALLQAEAAAAGLTITEWITACAPMRCADARGSITPSHRTADNELLSDTPGREVAAQPPSEADPSRHTGVTRNGASAPRTMLDVLEGRLGTIASGGLDAIAARPGDPFSDYLIEKKRSGRL